MLELPRMLMSNRRDSSMVWSWLMLLNEIASLPLPAWTLKRAAPPEWGAVGAIDKGAVVVIDLEGVGVEQRVEVLLPAPARPGRVAAPGRACSS